jgi:chorismate synthase
MPGNTFGTSLTITTFGESHGKALGVIIDGLESNFTIDLEDLAYQMARRRPGGNPLGTKRNEQDEIEILSGVFEGKTTGTPLAILIRNTNQHSDDYSPIANFYRPGHADYTWDKKFGIRDWRGGGRSSGRETAARLAAGAIAMQILRQKGITIQAYTIQIGPIKAKVKHLDDIHKNLVSCCDNEQAQKMEQLINETRENKDSVGGIIECVISHVPVGLGEPVFQKTEALLAHAMLSLGATKGIEFGEGFNCVNFKGSEHNDPISSKGFVTNKAGGINGGITNGEDIVFRVPIKPTASISLPQETIGVDGKEKTIVVEGRHDPCICVRVVPVIEAMSALTILSLWYDQNGR